MNIWYRDLMLVRGQQWLKRADDAVALQIAPETTTDGAADGAVPESVPPRKRTYFSWFRKDHPMTQQEVDALVRQIEQASGENLEKMPVLVGTNQPFRNLVRFYIPQSKRQIPSRLLRTGITGLWLAALAAGKIKVPPLPPIPQTGTHYSRTFGTVNVDIPNRYALAHEIGHWVDFERGKGPYRRSWLGLYKDAPTRNPLIARELAATLLARKWLGEEEWKKARDSLEAALATYFVSPEHAVQSPVEWWRGGPVGKESWQKVLEEGLKNYDRSKLDRALRAAAIDFRRQLGETPVILTDAKGDFFWNPAIRPRIEPIVRQLLDAEYNRLYGQRQQPGGEEAQEKEHKRREGAQEQKKPLRKAAQAARYYLEMQTKPPVHGIVKTALPEKLEWFRQQIAQGVSDMARSAGNVVRGRLLDIAEDEARQRARERVGHYLGLQPKDMGWVPGVGVGGPLAASAVIPFLPKGAPGAVAAAAGSLSAVPRLYEETAAFLQRLRASQELGSWRPEEYHMIYGGKASPFFSAGMATLPWFVYWLRRELSRKDDRDNLTKNSSAATSAPSLPGADHPSTSVLARLMQAKLHSDAGRYDEKTKILRELMQRAPEDFYVDSPDGPYPGVTHRSGFRFHVAANAIPEAVRKNTPKG